MEWTADLEDAPFCSSLGCYVAQADGLLCLTLAGKNQAWKEVVHWPFTQ